MSAERDYLERTITTVRIHRGSENSWPQWANIFADEIERLWAERDALLAENERLLKWASTLDSPVARGMPTYDEAIAENERLREATQRVRAVVNEQAEDGALWAIHPCGEQPIAEAYLQQALRRLHSAVEAETAAAPAE